MAGVPVPGSTAAALVPLLSTEEIPRAIPQAPAEAASPPAAMVPPQVQPPPDDITSYKNEGQNSLGTLRDFMAEDEESSTLGIEVREGRRKLKSGEEAQGLLILKVEPKSPAAMAGLHAYRRTGQNVLTGVAIAAAIVFPPAILALPLIDYAQVGESYDLIIGVDGARVTNFLDFDDRMRNVEPGEVVYLSIVRDGRRMQLQVAVPPASNAPSY